MVTSSSDHTVQELLRLVDLNMKTLWYFKM